MGKWFDRVDRFLAVVFLLLYVGAKLHFFTRYASLSAGAYLEEHVWFWAAMVILALVGMVFAWLRKRFEHPHSN